MLCGVVLAGLVAGGFAAVHSSLFGARHLSVSGDVHTSAQQVLSAAGLLDHPPLVDIDPALAAARVEALPWIKTARVTLHWPDSVGVSVVERTAVAAVVMQGTATPDRLWALVDATGRVLAYQSIRPAGLVEIEVPAAPGSPGSHMAGPDQPGVEVAASLPMTLAPRVEAIEVGTNGVTLAMSGGLSVVIGAPVDLQSKYVALASVLSGAPLSSGEVIDVSVPQEPTVGPGPSRR